MRIRAAIQRKVTRYLFSIERRNTRRSQAEKKRKAANAPHLVEYFHQADDPYSHLMAQLLPEFCRRHDVQLKVHIVPPPPDWAAPDRQRLEAYARLDAERLAFRMGRDFRDPGAQPSAECIHAANVSLMSAVKSGDFLRQAAEIGQKLWTGSMLDTPVSDGMPVDDALLAADNHRDELGHYLGATLYYAGEWYWGADRLHYLETRLSELGADTEDKPAGVIFAPMDTPTTRAANSRGARAQLHWYLSFRSPYTGIVADRVKALADSFGADLNLRFVLPMVMRGMQVPRKKGFYIMSDVVREAERLGIAFGDIADPLGEPVERGYAILHQAIERGRGFEFARSFLSGVWAEGIDAGSNAGLEAITERAGLSWSDMKPFIGRNHWRDEAQANQQDMFRHGLWGVPGFRVGSVATWGQDRLWVVEDALRAEDQSREGM